MDLVSLALNLQVGAEVGSIPQVEMGLWLGGKDGIGGRAGWNVRANVLVSDITWNIRSQFSGKLCYVERTAHTQVNIPES